MNIVARYLQTNGIEECPAMNRLQEHGIIADEDRERVFDEWRRAVESGTDFNLSYHWKRPRDGSRIPVRVLGRRIGSEEKPLGWISEVTFIF